MQEMACNDNRLVMCVLGEGSGGKNSGYIRGESWDYLKTRQKGSWGPTHDVCCVSYLGSVHPFRNFGEGIYPFRNFGEGVYPFRM